MHDIIVISDLHLGRGKNPKTGRFYNLEAFFYDEDFRRFCQHLCQQAEAEARPFKLIINGDAFDFLRIEPEVPEDASMRERRYGATLTPSIASHLVEQILTGHPRFVDGLATVLLAGYDVVFLPGNHDIEIQWQPVQDVVRRTVLEAMQQHGDTPEALAAAAERLHFEPWFYYEPGRVWIEHGCQYDPENSFRYPLRRELAAVPDAIHEAERDLPLGNFFQRYLYNDFGHVTFIVPSSRANMRYMKWLLVNEPRLLFRVIFSHAPFMFQVIRRMAKSAELTSRRMLQETHLDELDSLAESSGLGDKLHQIDQLKEKRADVVQAAKSLTWQLVKLAGVGLLAALLSAALWFVGALSIDQLQAGFGLKALLFLALNLTLLVATLGVVVYALLRSPADNPIFPLQRAAERIANILQVSVVSFGHTHEEMIAPLRVDAPAGASSTEPQSAWYFNTGTWIAVFTHDVLLPRERVQYTFLRVRDHQADLLQWSPERREDLPVVLLEERTRTADRALSV